ncbi:MAG: hypothetical protein COA78_06430 [Blastopirellula sp.]|nr:MAG: hypothetical protein COA78_06430 [Blastopirellula sp.]
MFRQITCFSTLLLAIATASPAIAAERPSASRLLPDTTLAYVRVSNTQEFGEKFSETSMGKLLKDPEMAPFLTGVWSAITESVENIEQQVGISLNELLSIPNGELAFAVVPQEDDSLALVIFCDLGDRPQTAEKALEILKGFAIENGAAIERSTYKGTKITLIEGQNGLLAHVIKDNTLILSNKLAALEDILEYWDTPRESSLYDNDKFTTIISSSRGTKDEPAQFTWYVDPIELIRKASRNTPGSSFFLAFLPVLGVDGIQAVGGSMIMATEDFDSVSHLHVMLERPRSGVIEMIAPKNTNPTPNDWVPADVTTYMTVDWDVDKTYNALEKLYDSITGEGKLAENIDNRINQRLMIDFKKEIIDNLDGRITLVQWYEPPARLNSQATMLGIQLKDSTAFQRTIDSILDATPGLKDNLEKKSFATFSYYQTILQDRPLPDDADEDRRQRTQRARAMRPQPCFGIVGDFLFVTDRPGLMEHVMKTKRNVTDRLADDLSFKLMLSKLQHQAGERSIGMLTFSKPEQALRMWYDMAQAESTTQLLDSQAENNQFFGALSKTMKDNPLPPFSVVSKYMAPSGSIMINDETGIHFMGFSLKRNQE